MISNFKNKTAVLTGAGSGFGLECARIGAKLGMNIVLVDVQQDALDKAAAEITAEAAKFGGQVFFRGWYGPYEPNQHQTERTIVRPQYVHDDYLNGQYHLLHFYH